MSIFKSIVFCTTVAIFGVCGVIYNAAKAETRVEQKLLQYGGPETRTRCVQEAKSKGIPNCNVVNWTLKCEDTWVSACTAWATDIMQHEVFLVATGPDSPQQALKKILETAINRALAAAVAAAIATPGEVAIKIASAVTAFKVTLAADLAVEPVLASMQNQFNLSIRSTSDW